MCDLLEDTRELFVKRLIIFKPMTPDVHKMVKQMLKILQHFRRVTRGGEGGEVSKLTYLN